MTRETKIGLLVGLAFIIVIGILLSDHLTSSTEPMPAALSTTGSNVRRTVNTPGGNQPAVTAVVPPQKVEVQQQVPTPRELRDPTPPTSIVQVKGPGADQTQPAVQVTRTPDMAAPAVAPAVVRPEQVADARRPSQQDAAPVNTTTPLIPNNAVARVAQEHGEQLVPVSAGGQNRPVQPVAAAPAGTREYVAEPGDSVSRMADKLLGANTKANRDAIIAANPTLQQNPDKIVVGKTYRVPGTSAVSAAAAPVATAAKTPAAQQASASEFWYTIKEGDSLDRIAREQLGDSNAVNAILELNRDTIKDPNMIRVNMKIRLPGKPVAQAN